MLRIAICDDMPNQLALLMGFVREYIEKQKMEADVRQFNHPDALLTACENENFHIFLLDIVMPMLSGLQVGREIRHISTDVQIVYITSEPGYALDAYSVNPLHYLIKPVDKNALFAVLDLAAEKVNYGKDIEITIKTKKGLRTISTNMIISCEYRSHAAIYTLANGEKVETTTISGNFTEHIVPLHKDKRFIQPHAAYIVNMSFVERLDKKGFILWGDNFVPVSGKHYASVRNAYMNYRLGEDKQ